MKPTVAQGYTEGQSAKEDARLLSQLRAKLNRSVQRVAQLTTASTGVGTVLFTSDALEFEQRAVFKVDIHAANAAGTKYLNGKYTAFFVRQASGAAVQVGSTQTVYQDRSDAGITVTLGVNSDSKLTVTVNDGGLATMNWKAWVDIMLSSGA